MFICFFGETSHLYLSNQMHITQKIIHNYLQKNTKERRANNRYNNDLFEFIMIIVLF